MAAMEGSIVERLDDPRRIKYMLLPYDFTIFLDYTNQISIDERAYSGEQKDTFTTTGKFSILFNKQPALCLQTRKIELIDLKSARLCQEAIKKEGVLELIDYF